MEKEEGFFNHIFNEVYENFIGFIVGLGVTKFISNFFETRSIKNLFGLTAKRTVVSKSQFETMETMVSIVVGFFALMLMRQLMRKYIVPNMPYFKEKGREYYVKGETYVRELLNQHKVN